MIQERNGSGQDMLRAVYPQIGGQETFIRLRALNPSLRITLCSGFDRDGAINDVMALGASAFVQKPYTLEDLAKALRLT